MAYTARELITRALYLSGRVSREFQIPTGEQINDGLFLLNELLTEKAADQALISYFERYTFYTIVGQEKYFIEGLVKLEDITFNINTVRYPMIPRSRQQFFGEGRVDGIKSLPLSYRTERALGGMDIYLYFNPDRVYPMKIIGKFALLNVNLDTDLSVRFDSFFTKYLRYALARLICIDMNKPFNPEANNELRSSELILQDVSPYDLSVQILNPFDKGCGINYGYVNFPSGFTSNG
jgi:hypothetical protein